MITANNHTDLINALADRIKAKTYLEIGVSNRANNFDKIRVQFKIGVDPNPKALANFQGTSDEFFDLCAATDAFEQLRMQLIFIDGLHHADQVQKDFENSLKVLACGGYIVMHDTYPESELLTHVPRDKQGRWLGDVYKFACRLGEYSGIQFCTLDFDNGCTVVWQDGDCAKKEPVGEITWNRYVADRHELLNVMNLAKFQKMIDAPSKSVFAIP